MSQALLEVLNLSVALPKTADRRYAVESLSLTIRRGETLCVVGESGSGKSVTAHAVMQLLPKKSLHIESGQILLEGKNILDMSTVELRKIRGSKIAMIFQEPMTALNPVMTVGDQIEEALLMHGIKRGPIARQKVIQSLTEMQLPEPELLQHSYPFQLSGGQRQRVMIAMAMVAQPALLIADEPTTALDVTTQAQILALIDELKQRHNIGVLFITHDFGVVSDIADRVAVMQRGKLVEFGSRNDVLERPQHPYTKQLISAVPKLRTDQTTPTNIHKPLLEVRGLCKTYRARRQGFFQKPARFQALDNVDFHIGRGETLGVLGESGSGKSTLGHCIARLFDGDSGQLIFEGQAIEKLHGNALRAIRPKIQMIFQDPYSSLNPRHRIGRIITENAILHGVSKANAEKRMYEILDLVGIERTAINRYPHEFSGGQRQRIGIARALVLQPALIVADEPVSALDVSVQQQVLELLRTVRERYNLSLLFITHDLRVASQICDRIAIMSHGRIVECQAAADIYRNPQHPYTRSLLNAIPGRDNESLYASGTPTHLPTAALEPIL
ncbi:ABC transporter ATP-binding protein [Alcaligenaceae bacterium]|nr:ABC transporter ATP-binding protein [Alcaligenaceae bacterium]